MATPRGGGCGVLLDLAHLRVTTDQLGVDAKAFVRTHMSGPTNLGAVGLRDDHQEMVDVDYDLLEWVLGHTNAAVLTLAYPKARTLRQTFEAQLEASSLSWGTFGG